MRLALVHDYLNQYGGAERVLEALHDLFPEAPVYTSMYAPDLLPDFYRSWDIRTSFMQSLPGVTRHHQLYLPCYPVAFETFDFSGYDVVLSNSSAWAKGIVTPPETKHLCYCLTPMRWAWRYRDYVERERFGRWARLGLPPAMTALRVWDVTSSQRVDCFIAISNAVSARIRKYYGREAAVIYPPVDTSRFTNDRPPGDYYLVVSRLVPYKRIDLVVETFNRLGLPLKIAGSGRDREALERAAQPNIEFLGRVPDAEVVELLKGCRAFLFPGEEDFGIAPVEAQAAGRPVVAFAAGGALDTVVDDETGVLFARQEVATLAAAIERLERLAIDPARIAAHAARFDRAVFSAEIARAVDELVSKPTFADGRV
ncbi:MAG: glycosyltransferase [Chloroflexi bacterium]|nr:glycosyltransferase [Chloroflexota bacterium]